MSAYLRRRNRNVQHSLEPTVSDRLPMVMLALIVLAIVAASVLATHFFESVHYNNLLQQSYSVNSRLRTAMSTQQNDLRYLIRNWNGPLNCYPLSSSYAIQQCQRR